LRERNVSIGNRLESLRIVVCRFWGTVPGSLRNHLNIEELGRITITSLTAGGGLFGLVQALTLTAGLIFPATADAALATAVMTMILETYRRLGQGQEPVPSAPNGRGRASERRGPSRIE
jgi:hypothetical protein